MTDVPKTIDLNFDGYRREPAVSSLTDKAGVYCVYACTFNKDVKPKPTVSITKLVYIGESGDIRARTSNHNLLATWKKQLAAGQVLCFSTATAAPEATRQRAEAALIFKHKPPVNDEYTHSFPFETTTINASGQIAKLSKSLTVNKDAKD